MIKYKLIEMPGKAAGEATRYYPRICDRQKMSLSELCDLIELETTISSADIHGVLQALAMNIPALLADNRQIDLGILGSIRLEAVKKANENPHRAAPSGGKEVKIIITPSKELHSRLPDLQFKLQE